MENPSLARGAAAGLAVLGWAVTWGLPWIQVKPNRVAEGDFWFLWSSNPIWAAADLALWLLPAVLAARPSWARLSRPASWGVCLFVPLALAFLAGAVSSGLSPDGSPVRVSLSWGSWSALLLGSAGAIIGREAVPRPVRRIGLAAALLLVAYGLTAGSFRGLSLIREYSAQSDTFWTDVKTHLYLSGTAMLWGTLTGLTAGYGASRLVALRRVVFFILNLFQTLPSLALFGILIVPLAALGLGGIGTVPALIVLSVYAAFPIARAVVTALENLDLAVLDAGRGLGMDRWQLLWRVQVPLALPVVIQGVRTASVQAVGNTVVAALIGAGGLGSLIFLGLGQFAPDLILLGTLPALVLALSVDGVWGFVVRLSSRRKS